MSEVNNTAISHQSKLTSDEKRCNSCNNIIKAKAEICPHCGVCQRKPVSKAVLSQMT